MTPEEGKANPTRFSQCAVCGETIGWIECPTGGWWRHERHPDDHHDAIEATR